MAVEGSEPRTRRHRRAAWTRVSGGHVAMLVAGLVGGLFTLAALRENDDTATIAVATRDLRAGSGVARDDIRFERVRADGALLESLVTRATDLAGSVLTAGVHAGEPLELDELGRRAATDGRRAMSIPVAPARAANGELDVGDLVDVVSAGDREVAIIVAGAPVLDVDEPGSGALGSADDTLGVTLAVDARQSLLLAAAVAREEVFLTRVTGSRSAVGVPPLALGEVPAP